VQPVGAEGQPFGGDLGLHGGFGLQRGLDRQAVLAGEDLRDREWFGRGVRVQLERAQRERDPVIAVSSSRHE
jgi:hypothetical protein